MVSYILITGYSILLFTNPLNFVAVVLKLLLVNLLAALPTFLKMKKNVWKIKKNVKNVKNVTRIKQKRYYIYVKKWNEVVVMVREAETT